MPKFNSSTKSKKLTENLAGGQAHKQSPESALASHLLTSFVSDQYYRSQGEGIKALQSLIEQCDKKFVAQAAIYTRNEFGMRSVSHVVAAELAKFISGESWGKDFYNKIVHRPDDMTEILSYYFENNKKVSNAIKKGFAQAFDKFDSYSLAKYKANNKSVKLVDVVNLVHPKANSKNADALKKLVEGNLTSFDTWESELSKVGKQTSDESEKQQLKSEAWAKLITENKLGYFALLRNLRNILRDCPTLVDSVCEQLVNKNSIKKSLVLPFRFVTAYNEIQNLDCNSSQRKVLKSLSDAIDISLDNVPKLSGETLVVLDVSASMGNKSEPKSPASIGSLFSAVLCKVNLCDFLTFDSVARYHRLNLNDSIYTIRDSIHFNGGGTDFNKIFNVINKKYDRIIILSDMQGWIGYYSPAAKFNHYKYTYKCNPYVYSFDLSGYGTLQFPEKNVFALAGFSEKVFDIMDLLEKDPNALVNEIKSKVVL